MSEIAPDSAAAIESWHAHVYFDRATKTRAWNLKQRVSEAFGDRVTVGRFHERPVGPHPMWSFQIAFQPEVFADLVPWLALERDGLIVLVHPNAGDDLLDHRDRALWLGAGLDLKLGMFERTG